MKKLLEIGINEEMKPYRQDIVWISNLSALVLLFVSVILFVFFAMINPSDLSFVIFPVFVSLFTLVLNAIHLTSLARFVFLAGGSIFFTSLHGYFLLPGQELMNHFLGLQFSFFVLAWLMIDLREPWFLYFTLAILAAIFFCFPFANTYLDAVNDYSIVNSVEYVWTISLVYIAIFLLSAYCIQKRSMFSEKSFLTARETLEEKTKEIQRQEDELKKTLADISKTHEEDDKRSWISTGIADVNSILRVQDDTLYDRLIKGIVKYAGLMYGGIYETEESESEDKYFVLRSCYGFDREKLLKKKYPVNEGILGRVYLSELRFIQ